MKKFLIGILITGIFAAQNQMASAVTVTSGDADEQILIVTQAGKRIEVALPPKGTVTTCEKGCFMAFPSGDMLPLTGPEKVIVEGGKGQLQLQ